MIIISQYKNRWKYCLISLLHQPFQQSCLNVLLPISNLQLLYQNLFCHFSQENFLEKNVQKDFDKAAEDLRLATRHLGMIVGKVDVEEILGSIFNDFCIGK